MGRSELVERDQELRSLADAWRAAALGTPQVVLIEGPAGVGKSALLTRFVSEQVDGATLSWSGDAAETALPFGMVGQLLPQAAAWGDPFTAGRALLTRLGEVASGGPLLLALDDLHLADRPSLVALNFAIRRMRHDPVLTVCTARSPHADALPGSMVRAAADAGLRVRLNGLSTPAIQEVAAQLDVGHVSLAAADRLRAVTDGMPLHVRALLQEVPLHELEELEHPLPAPASFGQLVLRNLAELGPTSRQVASAAAVLGERAEMADVVAVAGLDIDTCLFAVEVLGHAGVLRAPAGRSWAEFAHPLVRAAVYSDLGPAARSVLHRRAAHVSDGYAALQHRISATVTTDSDLADDLDAWARHQQRVGNLTFAATAMHAAHRVTPPGPQADSRLLATVELHASVGNARAAQQHSAKIATLAETGRRLAVQSRLAWLAGRTDDAVLLARQAWQHTDLGAHERDLLAALLTQIEVLSDNQQEAIAWADRALSEGTLDRRLASHTRAQRALALGLSGRLHDALAALGDLPDDPTQVDAHRHPELSTRGHLRLWAGPPAAAEADLTAAASLTHGDLQPFRLTAAAGAARSLFHAGEWDRSLAAYKELLTLAEDMEQHWILGFLHAEAAAIPAGRGDWQTAQRHVDTALRLAREAGQATSAYADEANAFLNYCRGDPQAVVDATERLRRTPEASPQRDIAMFSWPLHLVVALTQLGRIGDAQAELQWITARQRRESTRTQAAVLRVAGQLAAARHDLEQGRGYLTEAVETADDRVDALEQALALEALGRFLRRRGERRAAVDRLRSARRRFEALRAEPFLTRCDDELAACGVHDPATGRPPDPLTPQERVVATLISAGRTNQQAADELVLSVKTIGFHVANVYAKLGVHIRTQLVTALRDLEAGAT